MLNSVCKEKEGVDRRKEPEGRLIQFFFFFFFSVADGLASKLAMVGCFVKEPVGSARAELTRMKNMR